ncbi:MAG: N-acetylglucosaminyldiphosphoundecaprenol N-acetyl-beta-D-mannosaminyltransferase [Candidatus Marinamargulisbacteria bacterium]|jgi:N-acetylglucosaminyldiphosphoundecaprenol N-acetyl-beta-D-mannosaminyltransferase
MISTVNLFNFKIAKTSYSALVQYFHAIKDSRFFHVVTLNPEMIVFSEETPELKSWIVEADLRVPDGVGLVWALRLLKKTIVTQITGIGLTQRLLKSGKFSFYLVGSTPFIIKKAVDQISVNYPNAVIKGYHHGYFTKEQETTILTEVVDGEPDIILVGMGFPRQEVFLRLVRQRVSKGIGMGVGGVFDVLSGETRRAPLIFRKIGLEWAFRGLSDRRRFSRLRFIPKYLSICLGRTRKRRTYATSTNS